ncbi:MAG: hypothetical protein KA184_11230 [Candidatus Hydrogenedentes bacterium]|nr:hypothetical protein [Candidatus Hydrogenedentota bacterium]
MVRSSRLILPAMFLVACVFGCAHNGKGVDAEQVEVTEASSEREEALNELVRHTIASAQRGQDEARGDIVFRRPYFFKEYSVYPDGADEFDADIRETESRTAPVVANVTLEKQRFATRLHRKRAEAAADENFLRDTGVETMTFEWRGGQWKRVGTLFVAEKTEEYVNGEWVPPQEEIQRTVAEEERPGWWGRTWGKITGVF